VDTRTLQYYSDHSVELARKYAAAAGGVSQHFQEAWPPCSRILDIGCGSGRDFLQLTQAGHTVFGVDACEAMVDRAIEECHRQHVDTNGRFFCETLPDLCSFRDDEFDGVLCSGVLMHVPESRIFDSVYTIRRILKPGGRLLVSIPLRNGDVDPESRRDADGRLFINLPPEKLRLLLERVGFRFIWSKTSEDSLGRESRTWAVMLLAKADGTSNRPLDTVEGVLNRDKKDATYKIALFRALAEIAQTNFNIVRYRDGSSVDIPIEAIAEKWLRYFWPIIGHETFIPQKHGESPSCAKPVAFRREMVAVINQWRGKGGLSAFIAASRSQKLTNGEAKLHNQLMSKLKQTIWNMPVRYAGGGENFSILQYDKAEKAVVLSADLWRELSLTGSWIQDATVLRWAELTSRLSKGALKPSTVIDCLLSCIESEREVADARNVYQRLGDKHCVWTDQLILQRFDVDHVIPFALWKNNDLWNLLPVLPAVNNEKRDRLPSQQILKASKERILHYWGEVRFFHPQRFDREAVALCGTLDSGNWENRLFSGMAEAVEITAVQRGVERWEP
jgi:SAM-dependent methyltransferase